MIMDKLMKALFSASFFRQRYLCASRPSKVKPPVLRKISTLRVVFFSKTLLVVQHIPFKPEKGSGK
jgi:hypothetical protein